MKILVNTDYYHETFRDMPQGLEVCFAEGKPIYSVRDMDEKIRDVEILVIQGVQIRRGNASKGPHIGSFGDVRFLKGGGPRRSVVGNDKPHSDTR